LDEAILGEQTHNEKGLSKSAAFWQAYISYLAKKDRRPFRLKHYKGDSKGTPQFGLIAEEVAEVNPGAPGAYVVRAECSGASCRASEGIALKFVA
jgi:hypothetical protein